MSSAKAQKGGFALGLIVGLLIGLALALAVALYVTKVPIPFVNKVPQRSAEQDAAEMERNKNWDPNAPLYGKNPARPVTPPGGVLPSAEPASAAVAKDRKDKDAKDKADAPAAVASAPRAAPKAADPIGELAAARSGTPAGADPFIYFVQAGAFRTAEDAEAQRAKLSLMGIEAKVHEREQSGRQVYRVRVGPFDKKEEADRQKEKLEAGGFETALVRVQR